MKNLISLFLSLLILSSCGKVGLNKISGPMSGGTPGNENDVQLIFPDESNFNFGSRLIGVPFSKLITVKNTGKAPVDNLSLNSFYSPNFFLADPFPGSGGNCQSVLNAGASCSIQVTFNPQSSGFLTDSATVSFQVNGFPYSITHSISGTGLNVGKLVFVGADDPTDFGLIAIGSSSVKTFTVSNVGDYPATAITTGSFNQGFSLSSGSSCLSSLDPGKQCQVKVSFSPTDSITYVDHLALQYNNGKTSDSLSLSVKGGAQAPASLTLTSSNFDFGTQLVGSNTSLTLTIKNVGQTTATNVTSTTLAAPFSFAGNSFPGTGGTCSSNILPNASCTMVLNFYPTVAGSATGSFSVKYFSGVGNNTLPITVTGMGQAAATLVASENPYNYGSVFVGDSASHVFTITNSGSVTATMSAETFNGPFSFVGGTYPGTSGTCGSQIAPAASCSIAVSFAPTASGSASGNVNLSFFNGSTQQNSAITLSGNGKTVASLAINESSYDYGSVFVGLSKNHTFTVTNSGSVAAPLILETITGSSFSFAGGSFPGTSGTCASSVDPGASCTINVSFTPTTAGAASGQLKLSYSNGMTTSNATANLNGSGQNPIQLTLTEATYNFTNVSVGTSATHAFTLSNSSGQAVALSSGIVTGTAFAFNGATYPGTGGTCSTSLPSGSSCTLFVSYSPQTASSASGQLTVNYNNGVAASSVSSTLSGNASNPALLTITESAYDYGNVTTGSSKSHVFSVTNSGDVTASLTNEVVAGTGFTFSGGSFPGTSGTCTTSLAAGATCKLSVDFSPSSAGSASGSINIVYNNSVSPSLASASLNGNSITAANLTLTESTYNYGNLAVGATSAHVFILSNSGGSQASLTSENVTGSGFSFTGGTYPGTGGSCLTTLSAGASCSISVSFAPSVTGSASGSAVVNYNNGVTSVSVSSTLNGTGITPATLFISETSYDFGNVIVGNSASHTFTLTNNGGATATFNSKTVSGSGLSFTGGSFPGTSGTCTSSLSVSSSCTVSISFNPSATGVVTGSVDFNYDSGATSNNVISSSLHGVGVTQAALAIAPSSYDYGNVILGNTSSHSFTITNSGGSAATLTAKTVTGAGYAFTGGTFPGTSGTCSSTVAAGASCTVSVSFSPLSAATSSGLVSFNYDNGASSGVASASLNGVGINPAALTITESNYDFGNVIVGNTASHTLTVSNTGNVSASLTAETVSGTGFAFSGGAYPGTSGNCSASLAAGSSCTISVAFAPATTGASTGSVNIGYNNGINAQTATSSLNGTGITPATLILTETTYNYGSVTVGQSSSHTFTLSNSGGSSASLTSHTVSGTGFSYTGGSYPGTGGTCSSTLASAASCTISVAFTPTVSGSATGSASFGFNNGVTSGSVSSTLNGTGVNPATLTLSENSYDFGNVVVGNSASHTFTLTNNGGVSASLTSETVSGSGFSFAGGSFPGSGGNCSTTLTAGSTCTIIANFAPTAAGAVSGNLTLNYNNTITSSSVAATLNGTGISPATLAITPSTYNYGNVIVGNSVAHLFTVTNSGGTTAALSSEIVSGSGFSFAGNFYPGTGATCSTNLAAGASCSINVSFSPATTGSATGTVTLSYNNGVTTGSATATLNGVGQNPALLAISPASYDFGNVFVGNSASKSFMITNSGDVAATITSNSLTGSGYSYVGGSFPGTGGTCSTTVTNGSSCTVVVSFAPTSAGAASGSMTLNYNNGLVAGSVSATLNGAGVNKALLSFTSPTYDYGTVMVGSSSQANLTIINSGGTTATSLSESLLTSGFSYVGGTYPGTGGTCGTTLANGSSCTIAVKFAPTAAGSANNTYTVTYNDGVNSVSTSTNLTGNGQNLASLTMTPGTTYNYGNVYIGSTSSKVFTLTNSGTMSATSVAISGLTSPFKYTGGSYPGTGGTCGTTITGGSSCLVSIDLAPTSYASFSDTLTVAYNNGSASTSITENLSGIGLWQPGSIDTAFGTNGFVKDTGNGSYIAQLALQSDGKIVAVGSGSNGSDFDVLFARFNSSGTYDTGFNSTGYNLVDIGHRDNFGYGLNIDSSGNIYGVGAESNDKIPVIRLLSDGTLDTSFTGQHGKFELNVGPNTDVGNSIEIQADGYIVVAGYSYTNNTLLDDFFITRLKNPSAGWDNTFNGNGKLITDIGGNTDDYSYKMRTQSTGKFILAGASKNSSTGYYDAELICVTTAGVLDTTFGTSGKVRTSIFTGNSYIKNISILSNDSIMAVIQAQNGSAYDVLVAKYTSSGVLDTSFNGTGYVNIGSWSNTVSANYSVKVQSDGKILVGGYKYNGSNYNFAVARINTNGTMDTSFMSTGVSVITGITATTDSSFDLIIDSTGEIVVAGKYTSGSTDYFALTKLHQ